MIKEGRIKTDTKDIGEFFSDLEDMKTKMIAEAKIKTNMIDAKTLAELRSGVFLPTSYVPPKDVRALRHLVRHRIFLGRYRGIIKNQIKTEVRRRNLKYPDAAAIYVGNGKTWLCNLKNPVIDLYLAIYEAVDREPRKHPSGANQL